jgi:mannose-6-phosphate isomerase-like protein (cupin superfamily)
MTMKNVEEIRAGKQIIAVIIYSDFKKDGIEFFTPSEFSQQLGYMKHQKGYKIQEHIHRLQKREVKYTQETLFIRSGRVRVDFYTDDKAHFASRELKTGDVILLASGGHGFEFLEESEMIEVKQGPHGGDMDKERFEGRKS